MYSEDIGTLEVIYYTKRIQMHGNKFTIKSVLLQERMLLWCVYLIRHQVNLKTIMQVFLYV